jgi:DNA repair metallo-beta-lactamase
MNSAPSCHEIPGCRGCFVDAFRHPYLPKTKNSSNTFILSHWHGDHYGNLPRDGKYVGPARIHCTPVTASLLREIHGIPPEFVVEHDYGETWTHEIPSTTSLLSKQAQTTTCMVRITFYDANHCPGAALILFQIPNRSGGDVVHLHTGDMRYHDKMKEYPLLKEAALAKTIDTVLLDTTYAEPKHNFLPQHEAVEVVASTIVRLLNSSNEQVSPDQQQQHQDGAGLSASTLVLLSCYNIGKEKVLWEASTRTNQSVYVTERKYRMLQCIANESRNTGDNDVSYQIVQRCTTDPNVADIHVIPMGLAGELWPFFRPNYWACADYAKKLTKPYTRVVAFLPTGWADGSNWNKKNAVSSWDCADIRVEIRLVSYSEHSTFPELQEFIHFLQPRKVVPTVFKDEKDKVKIEARLQIDTHRAKEFFIQTMVQSSTRKDELNASIILPQHDEEPVTGISNSRSPQCTRHDWSTVDNDESSCYNIDLIVSMGFNKDDSLEAINRSHGDEHAAVEYLLQQSMRKESPEKASDTAKRVRETNHSCDRKSKTSRSPASESRIKKLTHFFKVKDPK